MIDFSLISLDESDPGVASAVRIARSAHNGQTRDYNGKDYVDDHVLPVAALVQKYDPGLVIPAVLHDTLEDTSLEEAAIYGMFGGIVASIVRGLSHAFTKSAFPQMSRATRKGAEVGRLYALGFGENGRGIHTIKAADVTHNSHSVAAENPEFARVYLKEKYDLVAALHAAHPALRKIAAETVREAGASIGLDFPLLDFESQSS